MAGTAGHHIRRVSAEHLTRYLRSRGRRAQIHRGDTVARRHFVDFLRHDGVIRSKKVAPRPQSPVDREAHGFETYLRDERMLAEATITYYVTFIREFLAIGFAGAALRSPASVPTMSCASYSGGPRGCT